MGDTGISWTHRPGSRGRTWNPVRGCSRVSEGCRHCYAESQAARIVRMGKGKPTAYDGLVKLVGGEPRWTGEVRLVADRLADPLRWREPSTVFVNSMSDLFHESLTNEQIAAVFGVMAACPDHVFQILTKRARRMREWFETPGIADMVETYRQIALAGRIEEYFAPERTAPIAEYPGYLVTTRGRVLSTSGSEHCLWCHAAISGDIHKKFCSKACRSKACYEKQQGRWTEPAGDPKEMAGDMADSGHRRIMLYRDGEGTRLLMHRLVLSAFDRPGTEGEQGCHIDGDATNNALWNLRWGSQSNNWDDRKRHGNRRSYTKLTSEQVDAIRELGARGVKGAEIGHLFGISDTQARNIVSGKQWVPEYKPEWPLQSAWLGVSVENQAAADERIPELLETPAAVRFLSCEPLLGALNLRRWLPLTDNERHLLAHGTSERSAPRVAWVISGCESGPGARPADVTWLRSLRDQCATAGVPYFLKQACCGCEPCDAFCPIQRGDGSHVKPGGVIELPYLDGVQHAAWPEARCRLTEIEKERDDLLAARGPCGNLDAFADGELPPEPAAAFRDHLGSCQRCQRVLLGRMQERMAAAGPCASVVAFADGELDVDSAVAFRDHLRGCERCKGALVETVQVAAQLSTMDPRGRR